jgi:hypothetical protein
MLYAAVDTGSMVRGAPFTVRSLSGIVTAIQKELISTGVPNTVITIVPPGALPPAGVSVVISAVRFLGRLKNQSVTLVPKVMFEFTQLPARVIVSVWLAMAEPIVPLIVTGVIVPVPAPTMPLAERIPAGALSAPPETMVLSQLAKSTANANKALAPNVLTFEIRKKLKFVITPP